MKKWKNEFLFVINLLLLHSQKFTYYYYYKYKIKKGQKKINEIK